MTLTGHSGEVRCLHLEGNRLVSGSVDTTIKVWDLDIQPSYSSIGEFQNSNDFTEKNRYLFTFFFVFQVVESQWLATPILSDVFK